MENQTREPDIQNPHIVIGLAGFVQTVDGFAISTNRVLRIQLPEDFTTAQGLLTSGEITRIGRDFELLAQVLRENPSRFAELLEASIQNRVDEAKRIARELRLTEEDFKRHGGGVLGAVGAIGSIADVTSLA